MSRGSETHRDLRNITQQIGAEENLSLHTPIRNSPGTLMPVKPSHLEAEFRFKCHRRNGSNRCRQQDHGPSPAVNTAGRKRLLQGHDKSLSAGVSGGETPFWHTLGLDQSSCSCQSMTLGHRFCSMHCHAAPADPAHPHS